MVALLYRKICWTCKDDLNVMLVKVTMVCGRVLICSCLIVDDCIYKDEAVSPKFDTLWSFVNFVKV